MVLDLIMAHRQATTTPTPLRRNPIATIKDTKHNKAAGTVYKVFMGPSKTEDPTHVRLQETGLLRMLTHSQSRISLWYNTRRKILRAAFNRMSS